MLLLFAVTSYFCAFVNQINLIRFAVILYYMPGGSVCFFFALKEDNIKICDWFSLKEIIKLRFLKTVKCLLLKYHAFIVYLSEPIFSLIIIKKVKLETMKLNQSIIWSIHFSYWLLGFISFKYNSIKNMNHLHYLPIRHSEFFCN